MGAFAFEALDDAGRTHKGILEGDTPRQVRQRLRERGWTPLDVEAAAQTGPRTRSRARIRPAELAIITRQLATLVRAALPIEEALHTAAAQSERTRVQGVLLAVRARVLEGHSLGDALRGFPQVFPEIYCATVGSGEQSGHLDLILERLADYTERRQQLRQRTLAALFYPMLLLMVSLGVTAGLVGYVVPQVVQVFDDIQQTLPLPTRILIAVSDFLREGWPALLIGSALLIGLGLWLIRHEAVRRRMHLFQLRLPLVGRLVRGANSARFTRTLSILVGAGVPILEALRIGGGVVGNLPMRAAVRHAAERVREGGSLHGALREGGHFPPMVVHLIASGEGSGKLDQMLERAADTQERELESLLAALVAIFEPLLILVMGALVLGIVLAILLPIFELNQLVGR